MWSLIGYIIGVPLVTWLVWRSGTGDKKLMEIFAVFFKGKISFLGPVRFKSHERSMEIGFNYQGSSGRNTFRVLYLSWEISGHQEWYFFPEFAKRFYFSRWNCTSFFHNGVTWIVGAKHCNPRVVVEKLRSQPDDFYKLFTANYAALRVRSEIHLTRTGFKKFLLANFQGLPDDAHSNPAAVGAFIKPLLSAVDAVNTIH